MLIRPFAEADRDAVIALWTACGLTRPWNDPGGDIDTCLRSAEAVLLVGELGRRVVASAMTGHDGHRGWLYYLAVDPACRRGGHGRALVQAAEAWLTARKIPKIMLMVRPDNTAVRGFYDALGYGEEQRVIFSRRLDGA